MQMLIVLLMLTEISVYMMYSMDSDDVINGYDQSSAYMMTVDLWRLAG